MPAMTASRLPVDSDAIRDLNSMLVILTSKPSSSPIALMTAMSKPSGTPSSFMYSNGGNSAFVPTLSTGRLSSAACALVLPSVVRLHPRRIASAMQTDTSLWKRSFILLLLFVVYFIFTDPADAASRAVRKKRGHALGNASSLSSNDIIKSGPALSSPFHR